MLATGANRGIGYLTALKFTLNVDIVSLGVRKAETGVTTDINGNREDMLMRTKEQADEQFTSIIDDGQIIGPNGKVLSDIVRL